jgi:hypothetical protein
MVRRTVCAVALVTLIAGCPATTQQGGGTGGQGGGEERSGGRDESALTGDQLEEVQKTVRVGMDAINSCFTEEMERQKDKKLAGKVHVKILIGVNRTADQVVIGEHTLNGPDFHACLIRTIRSFEFPKIPSPSWFSYPFEFSPAY